MRIAILHWLLFVCSCIGTGTAAAQTELRIPLAGNCFLTSANPTPDSISGEGITNWRGTASEFTIYFQTDSTCTVAAGLELSAANNSAISITINNKNYPLKISGSRLQEILLQKTFTLQRGYTKIVLKGLQKSGEQFPFIKNLVIKTAAPASAFHFVKEDSGNRFYWGRRGPSLHLSYEAPADKNIAWFYSELTVPEGGDAIGSYFMANGFKEGYFGMQVNDTNERRILFSLWSAYSTDDPAAIPDEEKIIVLQKGAGVHTGEFGNEGAGGQSYLRYPWSAGNTYRFLVHAAPDTTGGTVYTAYFFAPEENTWRLIASFRRPKTTAYLTRLHSFIENFIDTNGFLTRYCLYGNQWAVDTDGNWHELTKAYLTGDDIAGVQYRVDYKGGSDKSVFFLQNGGFLNNYTPLKQTFTRAASNKHPEIDFNHLP